MATSSVSSTSNTLVDQYVDAYIATQQYRYTPLDTKDTQLKAKQDFFTQLNSKLNNLLSAMDKFGTYKNVTTGEDDTAVTERKFVSATDIDSKFVTRNVSISQNDFLSATANGKALTGLSNIKVLQLASADSYVGKRVDVSKMIEKIDPDTGEVTKVGDLSGPLSTNLVGDKGSVKFKINETEFEVEYTNTDTNEDVMKKIVNAVNKSDVANKVNAAFIKDTSGTARLTFTAKSTGEENAITIESFGPEAIFLGIEGDGTTRTEYKDGEEYGGFIKVTAADLNSKINVNGITVTRGSNTIDDAIEGVTISLKKVHGVDDAPTNLDTQIDTDAVVKLIDPLIQAFNGISSFIVANKSAHGNDSSMVGLTSSLRSLVSVDISPEDTPEYKNSDTQPVKYLAELGFKIGADGVLTLSDTTKFNTLLKTDDGAKLISDAIQGFSENLAKYIDGLTSRDNQTGLIQSRLSSISQQIESNNKKIEQVDKSIEKLAESTRKQYTAYLSAYYNAQNQAALLSTFTTSSSSAYDSLVAQQAQGT
jgi:flagellar hook-associated protein 2